LEGERRDAENQPLLRNQHLDVLDESQHQGRPHFHARYGDDEASIGIGSGAVIAGGLPPRALRMVHEWSSAHEAELLDNWELAQRHQPLRAVDPLR
ncbi:MAG: hypothetical protein QOH12_2410, partial [Solirubrobacteraceae bacterium]|nr:hypothetical protein [Solirubrobacteraceae bacterium]